MEIIYGNYLLREKSKVARIFVARGSKFCAQRAARNDFRSTQTGLSKDLACVGRPEVRDGRSAEGQFSAKPERKREAGQGKGLLATLLVLTETERKAPH